MRQHHVIMSNKLLAKINVWELSLTRGGATILNQKGANRIVWSLSLSEYRSKKRINETVLKFTGVDSKEGFGPIAWYSFYVALRYTPKPSLNVDKNRQL